MSSAKFEANVLVLSVKRSYFNVKIIACNASAFCQSPAKFLLFNKVLRFCF